MVAGQAWIQERGLCVCWGWGCPRQGMSGVKAAGMTLACSCPDGRQPVQHTGPAGNEPSQGCTWESCTCRRRSLSDEPQSPVFSISSQALRSQGSPVAGYLPGKYLFLYFWRERGLGCQGENRPCRGTSGEDLGEFDGTTGKAQGFSRRLSPKQSCGSSPVVHECPGLP